MNCFKKSLLLSTCLTLLAPMVSFAKADKTLPEPRQVTAKRDYRPHVGLLYGFLIPEGSFDTTDSLGIDVGFQPFIPFGVGLEFVTTNLQHDNGANFNRNDLLAKFSYNFGGDTALIKHSYVGAGVGASFNSRSTDMVAAPLLGFDIPLAHRKGDCYFSVGANAKYSFYEGNQPDALTTNAVIKLWF